MSSLTKIDSSKDIGTSEIGKAQNWRKGLVLGILPITAVAIQSTLLPVNAYAANALMEEVVVTAQKRSENVNDVPVAITAQRGETLKALGIQSTSDLQAIVPGFSAGDSGLNTPVYTLRGIGFNDASYTATPAVGTYVDEVALPYTIMTKGANLDLERVEVLKGPQGLLYGRNSTGGAINYIANKPTDSLFFNVLARYSRFKTRDIEAVVSGPITEKIGARLAVHKVTSGEGFQYRKTDPGDTMGEVDRMSARLIFRFDPLDNLSFRFTASGWSDKGDPKAPQAIAVRARGPGPLHPEIDDYEYVDRDDDNTRVADWAPDRDWQINDKYYDVSLRSEWLIADTVNFVALISRGVVKTDGTSLPTSGVNNLHTEQGGIFARVETKAIELRFDGQLGDSIDWMVGASASDDEATETRHLLIDTVSSNQPGGPETANSPYGLALLSNRASQIGLSTASSEGVFANVDWHFAETISAHFGARYNRDVRNLSECGFVNAEDDSTEGVVGFTALFVGLQTTELNLNAANMRDGDCITYDPDTGESENPENLGNGRPDPIFDGVLDEDNISFKISMDWQPNEDQLYYVSWVRGFKSGSFPILNATTFEQYPAATQEQLDAFELGGKIDIFDRAMHIDYAVFYYDYKDKQLLNNLQDPTFGALPILSNAPKSRVMGAEFAVTWSPIDSLFMSLSGAWVDTEIKEFTAGDFFTGDETDYSGQEFNFSPKYQGSALVNYSIPVGDSMMFDMGANYSVTGSTNSTIEGYDEFEHDPYFKVGARMGLASVDETWRVSVFGRNITNELGTSSVFYFGDTIARHVNSPQSYGIEFEYTLGD